jgi:3-oxoadipate enol-lactonase
VTDLIVRRPGVDLFTTAEGPKGGPPLVLAHALGTDLSLWDEVLPRLPPGLRIVRYDMRGHGRSSVPPAPYAMGALVADAEAVCAAHQIRDAVFVGLSLGGLVAQGLAVKRLDLVRALVLSSTAARIGTPALWADRIATIRARGLEPAADAIMARWFGRGWQTNPAAPKWRARLAATAVEGYCGAAAAIAGTDFLTTTASLRLPALGIAGTEDGSTPPDMVRETLALIPGSEFHLIRRAGHLPCVDQPAAFAEILSGFLARIGHLTPQSPLPPHLGTL